jgi:polysaccharide transporter, PST family
MQVSRRLPESVRHFLQHTVIKNALSLYIVQFASYLPPLISLPYLTRVLGPDKFGLVTFGQSFILYFVTITEYGFALTATRLIAIHRDNREEVSRIFSAVMTAKAILTALGLCIMLGVVFAWPTLRVNWRLFLVSFLAVIGNFLFPVWLFQGLQKMQHIAMRDLAAKLIALLALFALVRRQSDYLIAAGLQSGGMVLAGLAGLIAVPLLLGVHFRWPGWGAVREVFRAGAPVFFSNVALAMHGATNVVIVGLMAPNREIAYFGGAQRLMSALGALVAPIVTAIYPHVSHKAAHAEEEAIRFVRKYALPMAAPFFLAGIVLFSSAPLVVRIILGKAFGPSVLVLRIMAFCPFTLSLSNSFSTHYMLACGYERAWMRIVVISVVVNFAVLIPLLYLVRGSLAVAITSTALDVFTLTLYWRFFQRHAALRMKSIERAVE